MGRAEAAARLGAVTRLLGGGADLPLTPARGGQRLRADTTREVSCRLFPTVAAAGRIVRGPRCLPLLTPLQPLKWFPETPEKGGCGKAQSWGLTPALRKRTTLRAGFRGPAPLTCRDPARPRAGWGMVGRLGGRESMWCICPWRQLTY